MLARPLQIEVILADDLFRILESRFAGERGIAAKVTRLTILPENRIGDDGDDVGQQTALMLERRFRPTALGNVADERAERRIIQPGNRHGAQFDRKLLSVTMQTADFATILGVRTLGCFRQFGQIAAKRRARRAAG